MKTSKNSFWAGLILSACSLLAVAFTAEDTGIRGSVSPAGAVESVTVIAGGTDSLKIRPVNGVFTGAVKPGICQLFVDASPGYRDMRLERIVVEEDRMTDVGNLVLEKILP